MNLDELESFHRLLLAGALTSEEFEREKRRILSEPVKMTRVSSPLALPVLGIPRAGIRPNSGFTVLAGLSSMATISLFLPWVRANGARLNFFDMHSVVANAMLAFGVEPPFVLRVMAILGVAGLSLFAWIGGGAVRLWGTLASSLVASPAITAVYVSTQRGTPVLGLYFAIGVCMQATAAWMLFRPGRRDLFGPTKKRSSTALQVALFSSLLLGSAISQWVLGRIFSRML